MTTSRIRSHALEDLSLAALRFALPPKWVIHDYKKDYGIDVQIEIFTDDGNATGLRFYGQLKATDKVNEDDALSLGRDHFEYWAAHSEPVLLLRYYADSQNFFWCWLHEVAWALKEEAKTLNVVKFLHPWDNNKTPGDIRTFLHERNRIFSDRLCPPFSVAVKSTGISINTLADIATRAGQHAPHGVFRFQAGEVADAAFVVLFNDGILTCTYLGLPGITVSEVEDALHVELVLLLVFLTACRYDRILAARPLVRFCAKHLFESAGDALLLPLLDSLVYTLGIKESYALSNRSDLSKFRKRNSLAFAGAMYVAAQRYGETSEWLAISRTELKSASHPRSRGAIAYSLGNSLFNSGSWNEALTMFRRAAKEDPSYLERDYFRREYAAAFFETGDLKSSASHYRAAMALSPSDRVRIMLGDVLYCAGKFKEALTEIERGLEGDLLPKDRVLGELLQALCLEMIEDWKIDFLQPSEDSVEILAILSSLSTEPLSELPQVLRPLILEHGANSFFNFNAAHLALSSGDSATAAYRYLHSAMRFRSDAEAWALAIGCCLQAKKTSLLYLGIVSGYFHVGELLLTKFFEHCAFATADEAAAESFRRQFGEVVHESRGLFRDEPVTIRFHGPKKKLVFEVSK